MNYYLFFGVMWLVWTELIFIFLRINDSENNWYADKLIAMFFSILITTTIGVCYNLWLHRDIFKSVFFVAIGIALFFVINYGVHKVIEYMKRVM